MQLCSEPVAEMFLSIYLFALLLLSKNVFAFEKKPMLVDIYSPPDSEEPTCHGVRINETWVIASGSCKKEVPLRLVLDGTKEEATIEHEDELKLYTDNVPVPVMFLKFPRKENSPKMGDVSYRTVYGLNGRAFFGPTYGQPLDVIPIAGDGDLVGSLIHRVMNFVL